jgi:hypothetical protein
MNGSGFPACVSIIPNEKTASCGGRMRAFIKDTFDLEEILRA